MTCCQHGGQSAIAKMWRNDLTQLYWQLDVVNLIFPLLLARTLDTLQLLFYPDGDVLLTKPLLHTYANAFPFAL